MATSISMLPGGQESVVALLDQMLSCATLADVEPKMLLPLSAAMRAESSTFLHFQVRGGQISLIRHAHAGRTPPN